MSNRAITLFIAILGLVFLPCLATAQVGVTEDFSSPVSNTILQMAPFDASTGEGSASSLIMLFASSKAAKLLIEVFDGTSLHQVASLAENDPGSTGVNSHVVLDLAPYTNGSNFVFVRFRHTAGWD